MTRLLLGVGIGIVLTVAVYWLGRVSVRWWL